MKPEGFDRVVLQIIFPTTFAAKITILEHNIKVSAVSYLNTKPLLYGIERHPLRQQLDLSVDYPAIVASKLRDGSADLGLVPVAAIPSIPGARIVADYGIAADGEVASVCIFSKVPIDQISRMFLDYQSRTSVRLAQILLKYYWKQDVEVIQAPENFINLINDTTAGVIIGDRALQQLSHFPYVYDLGTAWKDFTGLPFIFAAWVANKELPRNFTEQFNEANAVGLKHLPEIIAANPFPEYDLDHYYRKNILFHFNDAARLGLERFLAYVREMALFV